MANIDNLKTTDRINHTNIVFNFDSTASQWEEDEDFTSDDKFDLSTEQIALLIQANSFWANLLSSTSLSGAPSSVEVLLFKAGLAPITENGTTKYVQGLYNVTERDSSFVEKAEIAFDVSTAFSTNAGFHTALHELGHLYGLEDVDNIASGFDQRMTVMSYNTFSDGAGNPYIAITPMAMDIEAIRQMYNVTPIEDTVANVFDQSRFNGTTRMQTIWDNGGVDAFDLSAFNTSSRIDLRETLDTQNNFIDARTIVGTEIIYIAKGTIIENAKGGGGEDTIIGNSVDNILDGDGGNDTIYGSNGNDQLIGGAGNDTFVVSSANAGEVTITDDTGTLVIDGVTVGGAFGSGTEGGLASGIAIDPDEDGFYQLGGYTVVDEGDGDILLTNGTNSILLEDFSEGDYGIHLGTIDKEDIVIDETYNDAPVRYVTYYVPTSGEYLIQLETLAPPEEGVYQGYTQDANGAYEVQAQNVNATGGNDRYIATSYVSAPRGNTTLSFGAGNDIIESNYGRNYTQNVYAGDNRDFITTYGGAGTVYGEAGDDEFTLNPYGALAALTQIDGGDGRDTFIGFGAASINGGNGTDTWNISTGAYINHNVTLNAALGSFMIDNSLVDVSFTGIERINVITGNGNDSLLLGGGNDTIQAGFGQNTIDGGAGNDSIFYTGADSIHGGEGNDLIGMNLSPSGSSTIYGDAGNDTILAGSYNDWIAGGDDNDSVHGADGNDTIDGGAGADIIYGGDGSDSITGGLGNDTISDTLGSGFIDGGEGSDVLSGSGTIVGGEGDDKINGASGDDSIIGGIGDDYIDGNSGNNYIDAGAGNDTLQAYDGNSTLIGGEGADYFYSYGNSIISGDLGDDTVYLIDGDNFVQGGAGNDYVFTGVDTIQGGNDSIDGGDGNDTLGGGIGTDTIRGGADDDSITDWQGSNLLYGEDGNDVIIGAGSMYGGNGDDTLGYSALNPNSSSMFYGEDGNDTIYGSMGASTLSGGNGNDQLSLGNGDNLADGDSGNDTIYGGLGNDILLGGEGDDRIFEVGGQNQINAGFGANLIIGGTGHDTLTYNFALSGVSINLSSGFAISTNISDSIGINTIEAIVGSNFSDTVTGGDGNETIFGNVGDDSISSGLGNDAINGDDGNDTLSGGDGNDTLTGGDGIDSVVGGYGSNQLDGGLGVADTLSYAFANAGINMNLQTGVVTGNNISDTVTTGSFEVFYGTSFTDTIQGGDAVEFVRLRGGNDIVNLGAGGDTAAIEVLGNYNLQGGADIDTLGLSVNTAFNVNLSTGFVTYSTGSMTISGFERVFFNNSNDIGIGSSVAELFSASGGNDSINGAGGNDTITGGSGLDALVGGDGNDSIDGGTENDSILGDIGNDTLNGGDGNDTIIGGSGTDRIQGDYGNNFLDGGTGSDQLSYAFANAGISMNLVNNTVIGTGINDTLAGGTFEFFIDTIYSDTILGGAASEVVNFFGGSDIFNGGAGDDTAVMNVYANATLEGGAGIDTLGFNTALGAFNYDIQTGIISYSGGTMIATGFERILGTAGNDTMTGSAADELLSGGIGNDLLAGNSGNDSLFGAVGLDTIYGGDGNDSLTGGLDADWLFGENGNDYINAGGGLDTLNGGLGNDTLEGTADGIAKLFVLTQETTATDTVVLFDAAKGDKIDLSNFNNVYGISDISVSYNAALARLEITLPDQQLVLLTNTTATTLDASAFIFATRSTVSGTAGNDLINQSAATYGVQIDGLAGTDTITGSQHNDILTGGPGDSTDKADIIYGGGGHDSITGGYSNDSLYGDAGNDTIDGGIGNDVMTGSTGDDVYYANSASDVIVEQANEGTDTVHSTATLTLAANVENLVLYGTSGISGTGNALDNSITGNTASNVLNGGFGNDTMIGGLGNDSYYVDAAGDVVVENVGEGTDKVFSTITYTLAATLENLTLIGTDAINGTGNDSNNTILGNAAANALYGLAGNDAINGGGGDDTLVGGLGNDTYIIDSANVTVVEVEGEGTDRVISSLDTTLSADVENLTLTGLANINGTGNELNNSLAGNDANNILTGLDGNDALNGDLGADTLIGGTGNDTYTVESTGDVVIELANEGTDRVNSSIDYVLGDHLENLTLTGTAAISGTGNVLDNSITGNSANNLLTGLDGDDSLNGGVGNDTLIGGTGDDIYTVDSLGDVVNENAGEGTDRVTSAVDYTLGDHVENLTLSGSVATQGIGNGLNNSITGNSANNLLYGLAGNDTISGSTGNDHLYGGAGIDRLTGSGGNDIFHFSSTDSGSGLNQRDIITDFTVGADKIQLDDFAFGFNWLATGNFTAGGTGEGRYYDSGSSRILSFDRNGDGIADFEIQLSSKPAITGSDFLV